MPRFKLVSRELVNFPTEDKSINKNLTDNKIANKKFFENQIKFENNETEVVIPSSQSVESQQTEIKHPITNENTKEQVKDVDESFDEDDITKVVASIEKSLSNLDQAEVE